MRRLLASTSTALVGLLWIVPTIGLIVTALRPRALATTTGWWRTLVEPTQATLENMRSILASERIVTSLVNTALITVPTTVLVVLVAAMAGYALTWIDMPLREAMFAVVVALLVVPLQMALLPVASLYGRLGIFGSILGVVLFHVAFGLPFAIFLLRNYFSGLPRDLLEAARIDGASEARIFVRVILPLGLPAIASLAIFQFLWVWNDLLVALVFARTSSAPITVAIQQQLRQFGGNIDIISAATLLSMVVPLVVFFALQRHFTEGLLAGSVK